MTDDGQTRKEQITRLYNQVASGYGRVGPDLFAPFGRWLVASTHLSPGERVLDVATGRGAVLFAAVEEVGPAGFVVGIDLAERMIQELAADLHEMRITNAAVQQMDAEQLAFPSASFDAVLCSYALPLFPNVERAIAEFQRVLRPGGKIGVCVPSGRDERWLWYTQLVFAYHHTYQLSMQWVPRILDIVAVTHLLQEAGFVGLSTAIQDYEFVYATEQEWWEAQWRDAGRFPLENMPPEVLQQFKNEVFERLASMKQPDGFHVRRKAFSVVGSKPFIKKEKS